MQIRTLTSIFCKNAIFLFSIFCSKTLFAVPLEFIMTPDGTIRSNKPSEQFNQEEILKIKELYKNYVEYKKKLLSMTIDEKQLPTLENKITWGETKMTLLNKSEFEPYQVKNGNELFIQKKQVEIGGFTFNKIINISETTGLSKLHMPLMKIIII